MKKGHKGNFLGDGMNDLYLECSGYVTIHLSKFRGLHT